MDTADLISPEKPEEVSSSYSWVYKFIVFLWVSFCVLGFSWFSSRMFRGREQLKTNFRNIEEHLKRLQSALDERDLEAITAGEDIEVSTIGCENDIIQEKVDKSEEDKKDD